MKLKQLQELLARAIEEPGTADAAQLAVGIAAHPPLDAAARAGIYAEMYLARLQEALRADFPNLAHLLGEDGFHALTAEYTRLHPSASSDIGQFGLHLPDFLAKHPRQRGDEADLAQLEWALSAVFTAADAEPERPEALGQLGAAAGEARLSFVPALRVLALAHDVLPLWKELDAKSETLPAADRRPVSVAVWRKDFEVLHRALPAMEAEALVRAQSQASLAQVCEAFSEVEDASREAFRTLAAWFADGWVARVESA